MFWFVFLILNPFAVGFEIVFFPFERLESARLCLDALKGAYYPRGVDIPLRIYLDRRVDGQYNIDLFGFLEEFEWPHGKKSLSIRHENYGIQKQWLSVTVEKETLFVEDDVTVSPLYYYTLRQAISSLKQGNEEGILGIALQRPQWQMGRNEKGKWRRLDLISPEHPKMFAFQAPATWGLLVLPRPWREFQKWSWAFLSLDKNRDLSDGAITTKWAMERGDKALISPLMFEYLVRNDKSIIYFYPGNATAIAKPIHQEEKQASLYWQQKYSRDQLLDDVNFISELKFYNYKRLKWYNPCLDQFRITSKDSITSSIRIQDSLDKGTLQRVQRHLVNACGKTIIQITKDGFPPSDYKFDCFYEDDIVYPEYAIYCNYTRGLYPDHL